MTNHPVPRIIKSGRFFCVIFLFQVLLGCTSGGVYEKNYEFQGKVWHKDSAVQFEPLLTDTAQILNLGFSLRHSEDYPYSNLWLFVNVTSPDGHVQTDTMEYFLAEPDGSWIGDGGSDSRTLYWLYKRGVKLSQPGRYIFSVRQGMRRKQLKGPLSFSLWVEEAEIPKGKK